MHRDWVFRYWWWWHKHEWYADLTLTDCGRKLLHGLISWTSGVLLLSREKISFGMAANEIFIFIPWFYPRVVTVNNSRGWSHPWIPVVVLNCLETITTDMVIPQELEICPSVLSQFHHSQFPRWYILSYHFHIRIFFRWYECERIIYRGVLILAIMQLWSNS
jgi:hypothetical protein